jgi:hypothetical protein
VSSFAHCVSTCRGLPCSQVCLAVACVVSRWESAQPPPHVTKQCRTVCVVPLCAACSASRCHFNLPSVEAEEETHSKLPPIKVKFEIPYFTVSGMQVRTTRTQVYICGSVCWGGGTGLQATHSAGAWPYLGQCRQRMQCPTQVQETRVNATCISYCRACRWWQQQWQRRLQEALWRHDSGHCKRLVVSNECMRLLGSVKRCIVCLLPHRCAT